MYFVTYYLNSLLFNFITNKNTIGNIKLVRLLYDKICNCIMTLICKTVTIYAGVTLKFSRGLIFHNINKIGLSS